eukprot:379563_1
MKILLLGPGNAGKSTILNQIRRINDQYDKKLLDDRRKVTQEIQHAVIEYMRILCVQSDILSTQHNQNTQISVKRDYLRKELLALSSSAVLTPEIGFQIRSLWNDKGIKETLKQRKYFQIDDNVDHFMNKIEEISDAAYLPDFDDYLRFSQQTVGFSQCNVTSIWNEYLENLHHFEFLDPKGQRCERRKWQRIIGDDTDAILYVLAISDYDLTLYEDNETNCLVESLNVFRDIMVKNNGFKDKVLVVFFNKFDAFKKKIRKVPITVAFDDYPAEMDPHDSSDVIRFIAGKLYSVFEEREVESCAQPLRIIRTNALDADHMEKIITDITIDLVKKNMEK